MHATMNWYGTSKRQVFTHVSWPHKARLSPVVYRWDEFKGGALVDSLAIGAPVKYEFESVLRARAFLHAVRLEVSSLWSMPEPLLVIFMLILLNSAWK